MTLNEASDPEESRSLTVEEIDRIVNNILIEENTMYYKTIETLYVLPDERNEASDPGWETKMECLGTYLQKKLN